MEPTTTTPCSSCGAPITAGELAEGLAVRIDGRLICPLCVDTLPGTAQVKINQLRAIRGLDVTTYRVPRSRHPQLHAYSFTTTAQLNQHRRALQGGGRFDAPTIPVDHKPVPKLPPATRKAPPLHGPWVWIAGGAAAVLILGTVIGLGFSRGSTPPATGTADPTTPETVTKQRLDYAPTARAAWNEASVDPLCPGSVLAVIAKELDTEIAAELSAIDKQLAAGEANAAAHALATVEIPDDIRFRPLRERVENLSRRIAQARVATVVVAPMPPAEVPTEPPSLPALPSLPSDTPGDAPPAVGVAAVEPTETPLPAWHIPAVALGERPGQNAWRETGPSGRRLIAADGTISSVVLLEPGPYRCWIRVAPSETLDSTVNVIVGGNKSELLRLIRASPIDWYPIDIPDLVVATPEVQIQVTVIGRDTTVHAVFLEAPGGNGPGDAVLSGRATIPQVVIREDPSLATTTPATTDPETDVPAEPAEPTVADEPPAAPLPTPLALTDFTHKVVPWDPLELPPSRGRDDAADARYTAPDLGEPYMLSEQMRRTGNNHIAIRFSEPLPPASGVAILVHPRRIDREELVAVFSDQQGRSAKVPCPLIPMEWNTLLIAAPEHNAPWVTMRLEDIRSATTEFIVGKTVVTPGRPATVDDLGLRQRALLTPTYSELIDVVALISAQRKQRDPRWLNPSKVKILLTDRMTAGNWTTTVRARLKQVFKEPWKGEDAPRGMMEKLVLHDQWLTDLFKESDPAKATVHPSNHHLLVVISAGNEMQAGLTAEQGVNNFWLPLIESTLAKGILPVPVLGPSRVDEDKREDAERMWVLLDGELAKRKIALPKIDLRPARSLSVNRMETGHAKLASDLLCEALGELHARLLRLKPQR